MALARPLSMFQNNPDSLDCTRRCDQAVIRRESNSPDHAAMMLNQSLLFRFPPSPCRRSLPRCSRGFRTSCGRRRLRKKTISTRSKQSFACAVLSLQGNAPRISNVAHTPPIPSLNLQRRVRVTAERMVTRTRSESSSSALKVPKSSWLAHHCRCGKTTTALLQTRPRQEREREFRIPLHSSLALQLVAAPLATSLISIRVSKSLYMIRSSNTSMHRANYQVLDLHTCSGESSDVRLTI